MSTRAQVQTQAKTPAAATLTRIAQPPVAVPEREPDRPDITTQLEDAARLGHSLGAISVRNAAPSQIPTKPVIQRQELPEKEEEEELQMKREPAMIQRQEIPEKEEEEEEPQMKTEIGGLQQHGRGEGFRLADETAVRINRARASGQPLDGVIQAEMGETMGHDFSGVRVHTDSEADVLSEQLTAKAFTTGQDIFFRRGAYNPGSGSDRELIAHELGHVVQQRSGRVKGGGSGMTVRPADDAFEQEADAVSILGSNPRPSDGLQRAVAKSLKVSHTTKGKDTNHGDLDHKHHLLSLSEHSRNTYHTTDTQVIPRDRKPAKQIQRRIVTQQGEKGSEDLVILGSIGAYLSERTGDAVETLGTAHYDTIQENEPLYIIAHGSPNEVGGKTVTQMVEELTNESRKLPVEHNKVALAACQAGEKVEGNESYASKMQQEMKNLQPSYQNISVTGPPGIAVTNINDVTEMIVENFPAAQQIMKEMMPEERKKKIEMELKDMFSQDIKLRALAAIGKEEVKAMFNKFLEEREEGAHNVVHKL